MMIAAGNISITQVEETWLGQIFPMCVDVGMSLTATCYVSTAGNTGTAVIICGPVYSETVTHRGTMHACSALAESCLRGLLRLPKGPWGVCFKWRGHQAALCSPSPKVLQSASIECSRLS
ncbi:UNVERIFIED_CONTAM: hypothetical protein K2H54_031992 [Gekko kuhli]